MAKPEKLSDLSKDFGGVKTPPGYTDTTAPARPPAGPDSRRDPRDDTPKEGSRDGQA